MRLALALMVFVVSSVAGCGRASPTAPGPASRPEPAPTALAYEEQLTGGASADDVLPLVVTLHGRGSDPVRFQKFFDLDFAARIVHLQAPIKEHDGRAWFVFRGKTGATLRAEVDELADQATRTIERLVEERPTVGRPTLVGFSQGSIVVYAMVLRHPEAFEKALPVAGGLMSDPPPPMDKDASMPEVVAMHGERDPVIPPRASVSAIAALDQLGFPAQMRSFPDNVHWIDGDLKRALHDELRPESVTEGPATPE